ncbi:unknown [Clostridium sp. CAG:710]|nr:unknown [Clostridium sp. CAG:710]
MLEFKITQELKPNPKLLELIKEFTYKTKKGKVKVLLNTNLQFIEPTEYLIIYPITITIFEYKVNEISNKLFYIKERKEKYNLKEIKTF